MERKNQEEVSSKLGQAIALLSSIQPKGDQTVERACSSTSPVEECRQRGSASCNRALEVVRSVRERLLCGNDSRAEQRKNFSPYSVTASARKGFKNKQWNVKMYCLADKLAVRVPCTPSSKEILIEAGLGPKTIQISLSLTADEFRRIILSNYPKLKNGGGFELLRCIPNSKDLDVISSSIAQNPKLLKATVGSGQVYIRPIQKNLDLNADLEIVPECEVEEICNHCGKYVRVAVLRSHIQTCRWESLKTEFSTDSGSESEANKVSEIDNMEDDVILVKADDPTDVAETESAIVEHTLAVSKRSEEISCTILLEVLSELRKNIYESPMQFLVRREYVFDDALRTVQWPSFSIHNSVMVEFLGEAGEDGGGLLREFWTILFQQIKEFLFDGENRCVTKQDGIALQNKKFLYAGRLVAMGIVQGSSGIPFLSPPVYEYLCGKDVLALPVTVHDVPLYQVQELLKKIGKADDDITLQQVCLDDADHIFEAGYTKPISLLRMLDKVELMRTLMLYYALLRSQSSLNQFSEGLSSLGVLTMMKSYSSLMEPLFVYGKRKTLTADMFRSLIGKVHFSEQGTRDATKEKATYMMFLDLLYKIESHDDESLNNVSLGTLLSFCTGSTYPPPLGFGQPITVRFDANTEWPLASTCAIQLTLPSKFHDNYNKFKNNIIFAILNHGGFGLLSNIHSYVIMHYSNKFSHVHQHNFDTFGNYYLDSISH